MNTHPPPTALTVSLHNHSSTPSSTKATSSGRKALHSENIREKFRLSDSADASDAAEQISPHSQVRQEEDDVQKIENELDNTEKIEIKRIKPENKMANKNLKSNLKTKRSKKAAEPSKKYTPVKKITEFWASKPEGSRVQENKIDDKTLEPEAANTGYSFSNLGPLQTRLSGNSEKLGISEYLPGESLLSQPRGLELAAADWTDGSRRDRLSQSK